VILSSSEYTKSIDIWSLGCIFAELLGRTILFQGQNPVEQLEKFVAILGTPKEEDLPYKIEEWTHAYLKQLPNREPVKWVQLFPYANPLAVDLLSHLLVQVFI
jgi:mitogen-activated protein kinase 1/3